METSKELALVICEKIQNEYPDRPLWQTMIEIEDLIDNYVDKRLTAHGVVGEDTKNINKMNKEKTNLEKYETGSYFVNTGNTSNYPSEIITPLEMIWQPKEDITTYELAMCLPFFFRTQGVMPCEVDKSLSHFRHFKIVNHNS